MAAILPPMPMNAGVRRCIEIRTKPGSIVHALPPVGISGLGATSMESTIATVMQALTNAVPERGVAVPFSILNTIFAGTDARPEFGAPFINYVWTFGGWGATKYHDGPNAVASSYAGGTQNVPCELQERRYPILWQRYQIVADTGGPGRTRGGLALDQTMEYPNGPGTLSCIGNRARFGRRRVRLGGGRQGRPRHQPRHGERAQHWHLRGGRAGVRTGCGALLVGRAAVLGIRWSATPAKCGKTSKTTTYQSPRRRPSTGWS